MLHSYIEHLLRLVIYMYHHLHLNCHAGVLVLPTEFESIAVEYR